MSSDAPAASDGGAALPRQLDATRSDTVQPTAAGALAQPAAKKGGIDYSRFDGIVADDTAAAAAGASSEGALAQPTRFDFGDGEASASGIAGRNRLDGGPSPLGELGLRTNLSGGTMYSLARPVSELAASHNGSWHEWEIPLCTVAP